MKHLFKRKIPAVIKKSFPIILIAILALCLRLYLLPERTLFEADQEEIAFKAKEILSGDLVLLGPKTSLGGFSIGPGFSYLWAISAFIFNRVAISGAYLSIFLGLLFIIFTYITATKIFSKKVGTFLALTLSISAALIFWDQSPWAPSLFYLAELIIFYGIYISAKNKWGLPIASLGMALAFQSHFAVFLLLLPIVIYLFIYKPVMDKKSTFFSLAILTAGVLPVIIFDLLNGFVNFGRLTSVFSLGVSGTPPEKIKLIYTLILNSVDILWLHFSKIFKYLIFLAIIFFSIFKSVSDKKYRSLIILSLLFLFLPLVQFLFYKSTFSEYYLMTAVTPFIFLFGYFISEVKGGALPFIILMFLASFNLNTFLNHEKPMNLHAKEDIVKKIVEKGGAGDYGVSLSTDLGYNFGYRYLFSYFEITPDIPPLKDQKKIFTIVVPPNFDGIESMYEIDGIGLRWEGFE